jgi:hypothetical protein
VVRNLGQDQLDQRLTHEQARDQERQFFEQQEPFATAFRSHEARFGTWNLQAFLSGKLAEQITKKLPIIQSQMQSRLSEVENSLKQYPEPPTHNAVRIISDILLEISQHVRLEIEGNFPYKDWRIEWGDLQEAFFSSLLTLKPAMVTRGNRDKDVYSLHINGGRSMDDSIVVGDDDNDTSSNEDVRMSEATETPTKKRRMGGDTPGPSPLKARSKNSGSSSCTDTNQVPIANFSELKTKFQLDEVFEFLQKSSNARIPGHLDHRVTDEMTLQTLQNWHLPMNDFFDKLDGLLRSRLEVLFDEHFKRWAGTALYDAAWKIVTEMLNLNLHEQRTTMAAESLNDEKNGLYIFHKEVFSRDKDAIIILYRQHRYKARLISYKNERALAIGRPMTPVEETRLLKDEKLSTLLREDPYEVQVGVVADVTTYYMIAARRFHSSICMRVESKFFKQLRTQLRDELENGLGIHDEVKGT